MTRKPVSDAELAELGKFQGSIETNASLRQQALSHNLGRNVRVVKLLAYLGLMRRSGKSLPAQVQCVAAIRQNFCSSQSGTHMGQLEGPMQAAHFLPGQIMIGDKPVWAYSNDLATRGRIECLFAEVEHLPAVFNQADTSAEAKGEHGGLCSALTAACRAVLTAPDAEQSGAARGLRVSVPLLERAYLPWHQTAIIALQNAIRSKRSKPSIPPLAGDRFEGYTLESITARSTAKPSEWNRDFSLNVLEYYLQDQEQQRGWPWVLTGCQSVLREMESGFKP
jgi:hypothetical protein